MLGISSGNHPRLHSQPLGVRGGGTARRSPSRIRNGRGPISDCVGFADKGGVRARPPSGIPPDLVASNHLSESYISSPNVSVHPRCTLCTVGVERLVRCVVIVVQIRP